MDNGKSGEYICIETNVDHLQEAMPFEDIEVCMYLEKVYEKGIRFFFEYYSLGNQDKRKLAHGSNTILWAQRDNEKTKPKVINVPAEILKSLKQINIRIE